MPTTVPLTTLLAVLDSVHERTQALGYVKGAVFTSGPNAHWKVLESRDGIVAFERMGYQGVTFPGQGSVVRRRVAVDGSLRDPDTLLPDPLPTAHEVAAQVARLRELDGHHRGDALRAP